jgi:hypothetical protein
LHDLGVEGYHVHRESWRWLFCLVWQRGGERSDLRTGVGFERRNAGALVLGLVVVRGGIEDGGSGWCGIGVAVVGPVVVGDVGAFADDGVDAEVGIVGGEGAGDDGNAGGVVRIAVGIVGVGAEGADGVEDAGGVIRVAVCC